MGNAALRVGYSHADVAQGPPRRRHGRSDEIVAGLPRAREAEALVAPVELHIVLPHEDITEDPHVLVHAMRRDAEHAKRPDALQDQIRRVQGVVAATKAERDAGQLLLAAYHVKALEHLRAKHAGDG